MALEAAATIVQDPKLAPVVPTPTPRTVTVDTEGNIKGLETWLQASGVTMGDDEPAPTPAPVVTPQPAPVPGDTPPVVPDPNVRKVKIKHDGQEIEVPETDLIKLAQMGFDYTQKTQRLSERERSLAPFEGIISQIQQDPKLAKVLFDYWQGGQLPGQVTPAAPAPIKSDDPVEVLTQQVIERVTAQLAGQLPAQIQQHTAPLSHELNIQRLQQSVMTDPLYAQVQKSLGDMVRALPPSIGQKVFQDLDQNPKVYLEAYQAHREKIVKSLPPTPPVPPVVPGQGNPNPIVQTRTTAPLLETPGGAAPPAPTEERKKKTAKAKAEALRSGEVGALANWLAESGALDHFVEKEE
jgi:hypothetical protein